MEGMNREVEEGADDRKGGAGHLGKMLLSGTTAMGVSLRNELNLTAPLLDIASTAQVAVILNIPDDLTSTLTIDAWIAAVLTPLKGQVVEKTATSAKVIIAGDPAAERFPLKLRDEAINLGFSMLRTKSKAVLLAWIVRPCLTVACCRSSPGGGLGRVRD